MGTVPGQKAANADKFIEESRTQARRDLESAKVLLESPDPHLENVAFLLEQSYEKILKAAYVSYKTRVAPEPWKTTHKAIHNHNIIFMFGMLRDTHEHYAGWVERNTAKCEQITGILDELPDELRKTIDAIKETKSNIMTGIDKIERDLEQSIKRGNFVNFISKLNSNSLKRIDAKRNGVPDTIGLLDKYERTIPEAVRPSARDFENLKKYAIFFQTLLMLAPYTLPHAVNSRYPMDKHKMENLEAYRSSPELKGFFDELAYRIQTLLDSESGFTEQTIKAHPKNFSNPDKSA